MPRKSRVIADGADEERLRQLLSHLPVGVYRTTPEGRLLEGNAALAAILGFEKVGELREVDIRSLYLDHADRKKHLKDLKNTPVLFKEFPLRTRDGRIIWVRDYPMAVAGPGAKIDYIDGILVDVSELKQAEDALRQSENDYHQLFENALDAILILSEDGLTILEANPRACRLFGYSRAELAGMAFRKLAEGALVEHPPPPSASSRRLTRSVEAMLRRKSGEKLAMEIVAARTTYRGSNAILSIQRDITERKKMLETIREMAFHDPLTGLPNRLLFNDRLSLALIQARRKGILAAILFLDLDGFKEVNDTFGHAAGDLVLKMVAERLRRLLRRGDTVARLGGDEFLVLLPELGGLADAERMAGKIRAKLNAPLDISDRRVQTGTSLGIALYPIHGGTAEELMRHADAAMYEDKAARKRSRE
jgi:diguanylate cyclase (GGDEF)-like protein/PAS domain S-box-containing protein